MLQSTWKLYEDNQRLSFALALTVLLTANLADASELSGNWLSIGPSRSYANLSRIDRTWGSGVELSLTSLSIKRGGRDSFFIGGFSSLWAIGGANWLHANPASPRVYGEIGSWLLFSLGIGFSANLVERLLTDRFEAIYGITKVLTDLKIGFGNGTHRGLNLFLGSLRRSPFTQSFTR